MAEARAFQRSTKQCSTGHIKERMHMMDPKKFRLRLGCSVLLMMWCILTTSVAYGLGRAKEYPDKIRVRIVKAGHHIHLEHEHAVVVVDAATKKPISRGAWLDAHVDAENGLIKVGGLRTGVSQVLIVPQNGKAFLSVDGVSYRGAIRIRAAGTTSVSLINELQLDDFLYGVIGREIPAGWPSAALEAQTIAARSFAVDRIRMNAKKDYDIEANVTLAYGGIGAESPAVRAAVDATRDKILIYRGEVLPAYFSSTCGGHSEEIRYVYPETPAFPRSVRCNWCRKARFYQWDATYSWSEFEDAMRRMGVARGTVRGARVAKKTSTGRVAEVEITSDAGKKRISAHRFRVALGVDKLRSTWFSMTVSRGRLVVSGRGWGHGLGLCQNGAGEMAKSGWSAKKILQHYYPGAAIKGM
jgi:stage II sporulation protein D